jgi:hypothetical protein
MLRVLGRVRERLLQVLGQLVLRVLLMQALILWHNRP